MKSVIFSYDFVPVLEIYCVGSHAVDNVRESRGALAGRSVNLGSKLLYLRVCPSVTHSLTCLLYTIHTKGYRPCFLLQKKTFLCYFVCVSSYSVSHSVTDVTVFTFWPITQEKLFIENYKNRNMYVLKMSSSF